jgi:hypothetical protein
VVARLLAQTEETEPPGKATQEAVLQSTLVAAVVAPAQQEAMLPLDLLAVLVVQDQHGRKTVQVMPVAVLAVASKPPAQLLAVLVVVATEGTMLAPQQMQPLETLIRAAAAVADQVLQLLRQVEAAW